MTVGELLAKLEMAVREDGIPLTSEVKVQHQTELGPNHYTVDARVNGEPSVVIICTWRTDDPDRDGDPARL